MKKKRINRIFLLIPLCISVFLSVVIYGNMTRVESQKEKLAELEKQKEELLEEKNKLSEEVENLKEPGYAVRYARDHYIFPSEGEQVIKLPEISKE